MRRSKTSLGASSTLQAAAWLLRRRLQAALDFRRLGGVGPSQRRKISSPSTGSSPLPSCSGPSVSAAAPSRISADPQSPQRLPARRARRLLAGALGGYRPPTSGRSARKAARRSRFARRLRLRAARRRLAIVMNDAAHHRRGRSASNSAASLDAEPRPRLCRKMICPARAAGAMCDLPAADGAAVDQMARGPLAARRPRRPDGEAYVFDARKRRHRAAWPCPAAARRRGRLRCCCAFTKTGIAPRREEAITTVRRRAALVRSRPRLVRQLGHRFAARSARRPSCVSTWLAPHATRNANAAAYDERCLRHGGGDGGGESTWPS